MPPPHVPSRSSVTKIHVQVELELPPSDIEGRKWRERRGRGAPCKVGAEAPPTISVIATCATPDLLLKYLDKIFATYV
jgi:hypothetical protein